MRAAAVPAHCPLELMATDGLSWQRKAQPDARNRIAVHERHRGCVRQMDGAASEDGEGDVVCGALRSVGRAELAPDQHIDPCG